MKIKNIDLLKCVSPMKLICENNCIDFMTALRISKNVSSIDQAIGAYLTEKERLSKEYVVCSDGAPRLADGKEEEFAMAMTDLNEKDVDVAVERVCPDALAAVKMPPKLIDGIRFMLDEGKE